MKNFEKIGLISGYYALSLLRLKTSYDGVIDDLTEIVNNYNSTADKMINTQLESQEYRDQIELIKLLLDEKVTYDTLKTELERIDKRYYYNVLKMIKAVMKEIYNIENLQKLGTQYLAFRSMNVMMMSSSKFVKDTDLAVSVFLGSSCYEDIYKVIKLSTIDDAYLVFLAGVLYGLYYVKDI